MNIEELRAGEPSARRAALARAITLVESERPADAAAAAHLVEDALPHTGGGIRVGISGAPGAGKSTFIDALGMGLVQEHQVAVLTVDPSSAVSGGSILGDKTRMARLTKEMNAFIRPSPSAGHLGGVAAKTREAALLCEAAGYDIVLVETVGVGQSEFVVADMVDVTLTLIVGGTGDELQGIKRGLLERVDVVAINKADGDRQALAQRASLDYRAALRLMRGQDVSVLTCSALEGTGVQEVWSTLIDLRTKMEADGRLSDKRNEQVVRWMWRLVEAGLRAELRRDTSLRALLPELEAKMVGRETSAASAARALLDAFRR